MVDTVIAPVGSSANIPVPDRRELRDPLFDGIADMAGAGAKALQSKQATDDRVEAIEHQTAMREQKAADEHLFLTGQADWAARSASITGKIQQMRNEASQGGVGHQKKVRELLEQQLKDFDQQFGGNERVRQRFRTTLAQTAARITVQEDLWQRDALSASMGQMADSYVTERSNELRTNWSPELVEEVAAGWEATVDGMVGGDDYKAQVKRKGEEKIYQSAVEGMIAQGRFDEARQMIESGFFNDKVSDVDRLRRMVRTEANVARAATEREASAARSQVEDAADAMKALIDAGHIPTQAEMDTLKTAIRDAGLPIDDVVDFDLLTEQVAINRQSEGKTAVQLRAEVRTIEAAVAGGKATNSMRRTLPHLRKLLDDAEDREVEKYKGLLEQGVPGRMAILSQLPRDPEARMVQGDKIEQGLGLVAQLPKGTAQRALNGRNLRKDRPKDFGESKEVREAFAQVVGDLGPTLGDRYSDMMEMAWDIYAETMNNSGVVGFHPDAFTKIVNLAFGATKNSRGELQGGIARINGMVVELPDNRTAEEFARKLARKPLTGAVYSNGQEAQKSDILKHFRPVYIGNNVKGLPSYAFVDPAGRPLKESGGADYVVVID